MPLLPPDVGGGDVSGALHNDLAGRDAPDAHPIAAISGLQDWLNTLTDHDLATLPLRYVFTWSATTLQDVHLPQPWDTISAVVVVVRQADGNVIDPDIEYFYSPDGAFIRAIRLTFSPPISGTHLVHVVR